MNKLFPKWIFKKVTDMIIQNASRTFEPWQHTGIQSVLFNISKLPKKKHRGRWWTVRDLPFLIIHWGDSAIMNDVQTREFWHQKRGLRREWLFDLCKCLHPMSRLEGISARDGALVWGLNYDSVWPPVAKFMAVTWTHTSLQATGDLSSSGHWLGKYLMSGRNVCGGECGHRWV